MPAELATTLAATEVQRLEQAEALVRGFCGWHIAPSRTESVTVRGRGTKTLTLPTMHVTAVTSVTEDGRTLTVDDDYTWSAAGVLTRDGVWPVDAKVVVAMSHGHAPIPAEVTAIVQAIAQRAVNNPGSMTRKQIGPFSEQYATDSALSLLESEREALRRYRIPRVA